VSSSEQEEFVNTFEDVKGELLRQNPNDNATEDWDNEVIEGLRQYLNANGYPVHLGDTMYFLYDLLKWTKYNR
jgi:hypothetical protein